MLQRLTGLVQAVYGRQADFGPIEVCHRVEGGARIEPHMALRLSCRVDHHDVVVAGLRWRNARIMEDTVDGGRALVRATAPLALLPGNPTLLRRLDASAPLTSWLAFYARTGTRTALAPA